MSAISADALAEAVRQFRLIESFQSAEFAKLQARFATGQDLARELVQKGWLTTYQIERLLANRGSELLLGSYVLLDQLGQGGMGEAFKARNWKLGKVVALKVIRKEKLGSANAVRRFEREVRSAAQLNHPNIVHAYDADEVGGVHLLVMEYVEGIDLAKYVKQHGPMPIEQACDVIRQAALGLQHAHEHHLVHRDIKPHNILVSGGVVSGGVGTAPTTHHAPLTTHQIKILDMGLARLMHGAESASSVTAEGGLLGTPDYVAPEQALESSAVDIRADIYSLGSTFYFILAGRVPFPGGSIYEKMHKVQFVEPEPIEKVRAGVPPWVAKIVRKMMAKKPEDRYQVPAEVAAALERGHQPQPDTVDIQAKITTVAPSKVNTTGKVATLVVLQGQIPQTIYPLHEGDNVIGRSKGQAIDVDLKDQDNPNQVSISRKHAIIQLKGGKLTIQDLGSTNGTLVNQKPIKANEPFPLNNNDIIKLGRIQLKVTF